MTIRIRVVEEKDGKHVRSRSYYLGTATYEGVCTMLIGMGCVPSGKVAKTPFLRNIFKRLKNGK